MKLGLCVNPYCDSFCQPGLHHSSDKCCSRCGATLTLNQRYRLSHLLKPLEQSADIKIFEAEDVIDPDKRVVIKLLDHPHPSARIQLRREYEFLLQMPTPFLQIQLDDYFETQIHPDLPVLIYGLVLPKIDGMNSRQFVREQGKIPVSQAVKWLKQLLEFVKIMHKQGYLHRDIKPSNIMVHSDRTISLIDFGTVRKMDADYFSLIGGHLITQTGQAQTLTRIISPGFSAPEQIEGLAVPQSDFFSIARTFVYWTTGVFPQTVPVSKEGKLIWSKGLVALDSSLKQYIDEMMNATIALRPTKISLIQHYFNVDWPKSQRRHRLMMSPWFRGLTIVGLLGVVAMSYVSISFALSRFLFYRGSAHFLDGQYQPARRDLSLSLRIDPKFEEAHHNFASLCQRLQDYDCALDHSQKVLKLNNRRWQSHYNLGSIWEDLNRLNEARQAYEKAVELSKNQSLEPLNNLARVEILMQKPDAAIAHLKQAQTLTSGPDELAVIQKNLGWALFEQNQLSAALTELQKSQDLDPTLADTYCLMAQLYDGQKQSLEANNNWIACMALQTDSRDVYRWRQEFLQQKFLNEQDSP